MTMMLTWSLQHYAVLQKKNSRNRIKNRQSFSSLSLMPIARIMNH